jgi:hypothetical protein
MATFRVPTDYITLGKNADMTVHHERAVMHKQHSVVPFTLDVQSVSLPKTKTEIRFGGLLEYDHENVITQVIVDDIDPPLLDEPDLRQQFLVSVQVAVERMVKDTDLYRFFHILDRSHARVKLTVECVCVQKNGKKPYSRTFIAWRYLPIAQSERERALPALIWSLTIEAQRRYKNDWFVGVWNVIENKKTEVDNP